MTREELVGHIANYILANEPVTLDQLEARAKTKSWYSINEFDALLMLLKKDTRISATLTTTGIVYKKKKVYVSPLLVERERGVNWLRDNYPREELGESPFKICFCLFFRNDDSEIWHEGDTHRPDCDSILYPEEYSKQNYGNRRKQNSTTDTQMAAGKQLLLLA